MNKEELESAIADRYYAIWEYGQDYEPVSGLSFDDGFDVEKQIIVINEKKRLIAEFEDLVKKCNFAIKI